MYTSRLEIRVGPEDSVANPTANKKNFGLCQRLMVTHKACLSSASSLLLPVPIPVPMPVTAIATAIATAIVPNALSLVYLILKTACGVMT